MALGLAAALLGTQALTAQAQPNQAELSRLAAQAEQRFQMGLVAARLYAAANRLPMQWSLPNGGKAWLVGMDGPYPVIIRTFDRDSATTITANSVWPGGALGLNITGRSQTLHVWDDGLPNSPELAGRVTSGDGVAFPGSHATIVAGTAASTGLNPRARGVAYELNIVAYSMSNDSAEMAQAAAAGARLSNHSYGEFNGWNFGVLGDGLWVWFGRPSISQQIDFGWGFYNHVSQMYDQIAAAAPNYLIVQAAGNFRGDGPENQPVEHWAMDASGNFVRVSNQTRELNGGTTGFDSLPPRVAAKNILSVGAVLKIPGGYRQPSDVRAASFTCFGPRDDGGIKPDVVAPGVDIFGPEVGGGYTSADGTSFSSPGAAGAAALLRQHYENVRGNTPMMTSAMLRGLICHTANEAGPAPGPDYAFGWGLVNVRGAAELISRSEFEPSILTNLRLREGQTLDIPLGIGDGGEARVTIAWVDPAATPLTPALNNRTSRLVNDVDLRLIRRGDNTTFLPYVLDPVNPSARATNGDNTVDNIEQIRIANPQAGLYTLRISHKGPRLLPGGSQDVAVIITVPIEDAIRSLSLRPNRVTGGRQNTTGTVTVGAPVDTATTIQLRSSNPLVASLPSTVVIPTGQAAADFQITTRGVRNRTNITITAAKAGGVASAQLTVDPTTVTGFDLSTYDVVGGDVLSGTISLSDPAPRGGAVVALTSSALTAARPIRNWVLVPEGRSSASFTIRTFAVSDPRQVTLTASRGGVTLRAGQSDAVPGGRPLVVRRPELVGFELGASTVSSGGSVTATVILNGPASLRGSVVLLEADPSGVVTVPASVTVRAGQRRAEFRIQARSVTQATEVTVRATRFAHFEEATLTVRP